MNKERTKVGNIRINNNTKKPGTCVAVCYHANGWVESKWEDYEEHLLHTRMGMSSETNQVHTLQYFVDVLNGSKTTKQKDTIKIRYAYIGSPTNIQCDPGYYESLEFKVLSLAELEIRPNRINFEELITDNKEALIRILGRDICTGRVDRDGKDIYEGDILRWHTEGGSYIDEPVDNYTHFYEQDTERDCEVIGTIYDRDNILEIEVSEK